MSSNSDVVKVGNLFGADWGSWVPGQSLSMTAAVVAGDEGLLSIVPLTSVLLPSFVFIIVYKLKFSRCFTALMMTSSPLKYAESPTSKRLRVAILADAKKQTINSEVRTMNGTAKTKPRAPAFINRRLADGLCSIQRRLRRPLIG